MLTISQVAAASGVTVRAVRHYHAKGLLLEPERDHSGYRRYDAAAVVDLIKIRILADAGVPLSRVKELLDAGDDDFKKAVAEIDKRLRLEIRELQGHRDRIARLVHGDGLALPPEAVAYLERMRELGIPERIIEGERDAWILVAAQQPQSMEAFIRTKVGQLDDPNVIDTYGELVEMLEWKPGDPRVESIADQIVAQVEAISPEEWKAFAESDQAMPPELVDLLDSMFVEQVPVARDLMRLIEKRGWTGWTQLERIEPKR
ncbi:MerR family transcriptional regulator [Nocardioides albus]|uniref:DNA-binding transcriptional MerR regulator n=1 Tax=Nocardioides albus TaxID=1841 RepID=A0A7W5A154_9ACTN|nr:MerR family transcriptional regulator [Nocardioides albus]MBB3087757.1 DNA-binding transcriptional MerR regulator [Nocardioides albus]GGU20076.1 MerR family transcriptional regulator [Nocardioides albus]